VDGLPGDLRDWTSERVNTVFTAVQNIDRALGENTRRAIGDTELTLQYADTDGNDPAETTLCDHIYLYLTVNGLPNSELDVDLVVHEFGHILTLGSAGRTPNSESPGSSSDIENRPVELWRHVQWLRGFDETLGWDPTKRVNQANTPAELVADMFLYWVQGYPFEDDSFGRARDIFMNGGAIPSPAGDNLLRPDGSVVMSAGVQSWARNATCDSASGSVPVNIDDPALIMVNMANNGWCDMGSLTI
jgi:hypothetical protein